MSKKVFLIEETISCISGWDSTSVILDIAFKRKADAEHFIDIKEKHYCSDEWSNTGWDIKIVKVY